MSTTEPISYGEYLIWHAPSPLSSRSMDWAFAHRDFTSEHDGDARSGHEASEEECRSTIDFIEDMAREEETEEGKARLRRSSDRAMQILNYHLMARAMHQLLALPGIGNLPGFATGLHLEAARYARDQYAALNPEMLPAQGMEAASAGETQSGSTVGDSPAPEGSASNDYA